MTERWREILDDTQRGRALRALCRAVADAGVTLGGAWDKDALVEEITASLGEGDHRGAAALMAVLCLMEESEAEPQDR